MTARHDDPDDAEDVAGEAYDRWHNGLMRPLWRDATEAHRETWREHIQHARPRLTVAGRGKFNVLVARVRAEREARRRGEVA